MSRIVPPGNSSAWRGAIEVVVVGQPPADPNIAHARGELFGRWVGGEGFTEWAFYALTGHRRNPDSFAKLITGARA